MSHGHRHGHHPRPGRPPRRTSRLAGAGLLLASIGVSAAPPACQIEQLPQRPGQWVTVAPRPRPAGIPAAEAEQATATLNSVLGPVRQALRWAPIGGDLFADATHFYEPSEGNASQSLELTKRLPPYSASMAYDRFRCISGTVGHLNAASVGLGVFINGLPSHSVSQSFEPVRAGDERVEFFPMAALPPKEGAYWDWPVENGAPARLRLIGRPGQWPIAPMTKAEHYQARLRDLQAQMQPEPTGMAQMDEFNRGLNQKLRSLSARITQTLKSHTAAELAQPALLAEDQGDYAARADDLPPDRRLYVMVWNPGYFKAQRTRTGVQFAALRYVGGPDTTGGLRGPNERALVEDLERVKAFSTMSEALAKLVQP